MKIKKEFVVLSWEYVDGSPVIHAEEFDNLDEAIAYAEFVKKEFNRKPIILDSYKVMKNEGDKVD